MTTRRRIVDADPDDPGGRQDDRRLPGDTGCETDEQSTSGGDDDGGDGGEGDDGGEEGENDVRMDAPAPPVGGEWPLLNIDIRLLIDPDGDAEGHVREWRRVFKTFDPYLRYHFEKQLAYDDAQEVIGEIWYRAVRKIRTLTDPSRMLFWLIRIGRNALHDRRKADDRRLERERAYVMGGEEVDWRDAVLDALSAERLFRDRIDRREFRRHFASLDDMDQEFAILLKVEGWSHHALVTHFGLVSEDASKSRWQWIRRKLMKAMGTAPKPDGGWEASGGGPAAQ